MNISLEGRRAIVAGGSRGIGRSIALTLAAAGADVSICARGIEGLKAAAADIGKHGGKVHWGACDLGDASSITRYVADAAGALGGIDILVNNAGIQHTDLIEDFPVERWDAIIALNLSAVFHGTAAALPHMKKQGWGRIINIASAHGLVASVNKSSYVAAKHGVVGLTKVTALESAGQGITCNAICPGWVRTPLVEKQIQALAQKGGVDIEAAAKELLAEKQPSLQFVTPKQIGGAAVFLASDAAEQMTGTTLSLDGGWTAR
jgi:3-hydroxybutyrate dehydrogenase